MSRIVPGLFAAGLVLGLCGGAASAQQAASPLPLAPQVFPAQSAPFGYRPVAYEGYELVPPGVFGGPAFGYSGYGYYYDETGEGLLAVPPDRRRVVHRKRHR